MNANGHSIAKTVSARCVRLAAKANDAEGVLPSLETRSLAREREEDALVEITGAAVNPSDVKAAIGLMAHAVFPRTPGRDFAGVVVDGPAGLVGREVFGTSGDLGIRRDGTHASHLVVEAAACLLKPEHITALEAAGIGVPFVTAIESFRRAGMPKRDDTVLVLGVNGKVGQAATQIATWRGARVIGVTRRAASYQGHANGLVQVVDASAGDVAARVRELTAGKGADIVFNTVGDPYFEAGRKSLARDGRYILMAAMEGTVTFNIFEFYRGRHTYVGIDSLGLSSVASADRLRLITSGFASGALQPFPIEPGGVHRLEDAASAYRAVASPARQRIVFDPKR
jgi:NADPH2:quinone reductase